MPRQHQSTHKPNTYHSQATCRQRLIDIIYDFCSLEKRKNFQSQPLHTCIDQYHQVCMWLYWYICIAVEIGGICYYIVCSHRDLSMASGHMNWSEASKLFHQTLWNLINGNAFDCTNPCCILQASRIWWHVLTINNFLSRAVKP